MLDTIESTLSASWFWSFESSTFKFKFDFLRYSTELESSLTSVVRSVWSKVPSQAPNYWSGLKLSLLDGDEAK